MNEADAQSVIIRANDAARILGDRIVQEALNAQRADLFAKLTETNWRQRAAREAIYHQLKAVDNFEAQFRFHIENGKMAKSWLDQLRAQRELRRSRKTSGTRP